jgi:hypothetical protein
MAPEDGDVITYDGSAWVSQQGVDGSFGIGTATPGVTGLHNALATAFSGVWTATLTGNVNDYGPSGSEDATVFRFDPNGGARTITGLSNGVGGRLLLICNLGTATGEAINLAHESASSIAANRIICPGVTTTEIRRGGACLLWYDSTSSRWRTVLPLPP